jgi:hypothetical protein
MRFLLLLLESSKRFNEFVIDDLDDVTIAPYHTCELCPAMTNGHSTTPAWNICDLWLSLANVEFELSEMQNTCNELIMIQYKESFHEIIIQPLSSIPRRLQSTIHQC